MRALLGIARPVFVALAAQPALAQMVEPDPVNDADRAPYIRAALPLDEPRHLCIDLPGHGDRVNLEGAFTVHTCKDGMWNLDQRFLWSADGSSLEMPQYGKCLAAERAGPNSSLVLADCDTETAQFVSDSARLKLKADTALCVTIADVRSELTPGGKRFPERYRARPLTLEPCSDAAIERQLWSVTQPLDLETTLMPPAGSLPVED